MEKNINASASINTVVRENKCSSKLGSVSSANSVDAAVEEFLGHFLVMLAKWLVFVVIFIGLAFFFLFCEISINRLELISYLVQSLDKQVWRVQRRRGES